MKIKIVDRGFNDAFCEGFQTAVGFAIDTVAEDKSLSELEKIAEKLTGKRIIREASGGEDE